MYEVLYSDGAPLDIKKQAFELINHHGLKMGIAKLDPNMVSIRINGGISRIPRDLALMIQADLEANQKINGIKKLRDYARDNGIPSGLKECKDAVDEWIKIS